MSSSPEMDAVMRPFLASWSERLSDVAKVTAMEIHEKAAEMGIDLQTGEAE
jgi:hypothetical protein